MDRTHLEYYFLKYGTLSVINLRGDYQGKRWYSNVIDACQKFGIVHHDLALSAEDIPSAEQVSELIRLFRDPPLPVLIHCKAGADRSGLAAALWKLAVEGAPRSEAEQQLSICYGHVPFGATQSMDDFIREWPNGSSQSPLSIVFNMFLVFPSCR